MILDMVSSFAPKFNEMVCSLVSEVITITAPAPHKGPDNNSPLSIDVSLDYKRLVADGRLLREYSAHVVHKWLFQSPYHSMPSGDVSMGMFTSFNGSDRLNGSKHGLQQVRGESNDFQGSFLNAQVYSHTPEVMQEIREFWDKADVPGNVNVEATFGVKSNAEASQMGCLPAAAAATTTTTAMTAAAPPPPPPPPPPSPPPTPPAGRTPWTAC